LFGGLFGKQPGPQQQQQQPAAQPAVVQQQQPGTTENPEFPPYQVLQKGAAYDLRFYEVFPVVECDYQRREEGYLALGSYPDGANSSSSRFGHTQPVVMSYHPDVSRSSIDLYTQTAMIRVQPRAACTKLLAQPAPPCGGYLYAWMHACRGAR
jgi:hypothetical protein